MEHIFATQVSDYLKLRRIFERRSLRKNRRSDSQPHGNRSPEELPSEMNSQESLSFCKDEQEEVRLSPEFASTKYLDRVDSIDAETTTPGSTTCDTAFDDNLSRHESSSRLPHVGEAGAADFLVSSDDHHPLPPHMQLPPAPVLPIVASPEDLTADERTPFDGKPAAVEHPTPSGHVSLCLVGDALELMMAPGDVLAVKGNGRLAEIGTAHGFMGHVLLVLTAPTSIARNTEEAHRFEAAWPNDYIEELWQVRTLESTRSEHGLHEATMVLYVDRSSCQLVLIGEVGLDNELTLLEHETLDLWQSPTELRSRLRLDLMQKVLVDMKAYEACWSSVTAARAVLSSARIPPGGDPARTMEAVRSCWKREPICTSVVITFWQRYLCAFAADGDMNPQQVQPLDLILKWMPLKADRGLPGDLLGAMRGARWVTLSQVPRIFRPMVFIEQTAPTAAVPQVTYAGKLT